MTRRAAPMPPDRRREALVEATLPLLLEHGRATTTQQIARAAGVAEGTIFRAFGTKDALFAAVVERVFDPQALLDALTGIAPDQPLRDRLVALAALLQQRFSAVFGLMSAMGMAEPPPTMDTVPDWRQRSDAAMTALVARDAEAFRVEPAEVARILRQLTFSAAHPHLSEGRPMTPEEIVDVVMTGTVKAR